MIRFIVMVFAAAILGATTAQAQVYKCIDAAGRTVYSQDRCPANAKSATLSGTGPSAPPAASAESGAKSDAAKPDAAKSAAPKTPAEADRAFRKRQQEQQEAQKKENEKLAQAKEKEDNCRRAKEQAAALGFGRIARINDKGERYYLDDAQIGEEKTRARSLVDQWCN